MKQQNGLALKYLGSSRYWILCPAKLKIICCCAGDQQEEGREA